MTTPTARTHSATRPDVRPVHVEVLPDALADLRRRTAATRWPEQEAPELFTSEVRAAVRFLR